MSKILEMRSKRNKLWEDAKNNDRYNSEKQEIRKKNSHAELVQRVAMIYFFSNYNI